MRGPLVDPYEEPPEHDQRLTIVVVSTGAASTAAVRCTGAGVKGVPRPRTAAAGYAATTGPRWCGHTCNTQPTRRNIATGTATVYPAVTPDTWATWMAWSTAASEAKMR